ncbi:outer membrane beta-barrel protein [Chitinophaga oryzae]|uniref:Outer membrane beta-barrel protein n=1 Tax=Chitinophaga oryzae TaxID=2725414 RepID=A0ABX6LHT6_9BACT|nr:TonB-dependent receptor [Chitinophaga oryzae]QJB39490.1 outer membrane beta-barrel protein [Chitinophaga oryzae]
MKKMMRKIYLPGILLLCSLITTAQLSPLQTQIGDAATGKALAGVSVRITSWSDTAIVRTAMTDAQGKVSFTLPNGSYRLQLHSLGYTDSTLSFSIPAGRFPTLPAAIALHAGSRQLQTVTIKDNTPPVQMKGDTIEYNANKFKTKDNAVVEELLRKLPGVQVERDGSIKAQGETVQRVLVDGKEFFGSDPSIATRNLPADMIDKVQLLDKQSDMSEFTGVADGKQVKTINLVTKKNRKRGYFGNASAGLGSMDRYEGGVNANSFLNDMQLSLLLKGNNVNKSGFSASELIKMAGSNPDMFNNLPPAALSELMNMKGVKIMGTPEALAEIARPIGLTDTRFGGVNFNNDWRNGFKLRSSYFFNETNTRNNYDYARQYRLTDTAYNYLQNGNTVNYNMNQRIDFTVETPLNARTTLKLLPHADLNHFNNSQDRSFRSYTADGATLLNEGNQNTRTTGDNRLGAMEVQLRHRLAKAGRTLMLTAKPEYYENNTTLQNQFNSTFFHLPAGEKDSHIDQQTVSKSKVSSISGNIVYTEPLSRVLSLQLGQQLYYSDGAYDRQARNRSSSGSYDDTDPLYSDNYNTRKWQHTTKALLAGNYKKLRYTIGAGWQRSTVNGHSGLKGYTIDRQFQAWLPEAYAEYKTNSRQKLMFRYNTVAATPSVANMQPLADNTDPLYIRRGNPALDQEKSHRWSLSFNEVSPGSGNSIYANAGFDWYSSQVTDSTSIDKNTGQQLIIPVNVRGNYQASLSAGKSITLGPRNSSVSLGFTGTYSRNTLFNNGEANNNTVLTLAPDIHVNYYPADRISLNAAGSATWNNRRFAIRNGLPEKNWLLNYSLESIVVLPWNMTFDASLEGFSALGLAAGYNNTILLLNAGLNKEIGKHFSLHLSAKDLLNNNAGINRITGNGYIEDRKNNALGQYFMLSAIYKFRHFPKSKNK